MSNINNKVNNNEELKQQSTNMLCDACYKGYTDMVKQLIANGADVTEASSTAVFIAAERGNLCIAEILVEAGADPTRGLDIAAYNNDIDMVKYLLSKKGDLKGFRCAPLHYACINGNVEMVKLFIRAGIDVNYCDGLAIYDAIHKYNNELNASKIVRMLFKAGFNHMPHTSPKYDGEFIYDLDLIETLVRRNYSKILKMVLEQGYKLSYLEEQKAIEKAIDNENIEILKILFEFGANFDSTPSRYLKATVLNENYELTKFLLENDIEKHERALIVACSTGDIRIIKLLLDYGYDPRYDRSQPLLSACVKVKDIDTIKLLIEKGANVKARRNMALKYAVRTSKYELADCLIKAGANPRAITKKDLKLSDKKMNELIRVRKREKSFLYKLFD